MSYLLDTPHHDRRFRNNNGRVLQLVAPATNKVEQIPTLVRESMNTLRKYHTSQCGAEDITSMVVEGK
jgi:hypothetical protein